MKQTINILKYYAFWLKFMIILKWIFLIYNYDIFFTLPANEIWGIFRHGIIMDFSAAAYFTVIPSLFFTFGFFFKSKITPLFLRYYTLIFIILLSILGFVDMSLYREWGTRINALVLLYLKDIGGIYASLTTKQIITTPILLTAFCYLYFKIYNQYFSVEKLSTNKTKLIDSIISLIISILLIIPIRGGLNRAPLNHSSVFFSKNLDSNQAAYNFLWNFMYSVMKNSDKKVKVNYMSDDEAKKILQATVTNSDSTLLLNINNKKCNVIYIILESFSNKIIEPLGGVPNITPNLNKLCKESLYFNNFFATGNRSDKGITALIGSRPSDMNKRTILYFPEKISKLDFMPKYFAKHNYDMSFYYGGDINFYNTRSVILQSGIDKIISKSNFSLEISLKQKWGVPDEYLFEKMYDDISKKTEAFFCIGYNISSHPPFDVPNFKKIKGNDDQSKYLNSVAYTDSCLGNFINKVKASSIWDNTLIIITSDHTSRHPGMTDVIAPETYRIPLILTGGAVTENKKISKYGSANDFAGILINEMGWQHKPDLLSKNFISSNDYAFYFIDNGWAYISENIAWFSNIETNKQNFFYNNIPEKSDSIINFAKAYVQYLHNGHLAYE